jgi:ubiquitin-like 1-activating enzyme E1 B
LPELFGASEEEDEKGSEMTTTEGDNAEEIAKLKEEAQALKKIRGLIGTSDFAVKVFNKVFHEDIERLKSMSEMWKTRTPIFTENSLQSRISWSGACWTISKCSATV